MDFSAIIGFGLGLLLLVVAMMLAQLPFEALVSPEAILIVFGGTLAATLASFNQATLIAALKAARRSFIKDGLTPAGCIEYTMEVVKFIRSEGILAVQSVLPGVEIPFLRKGLQLVIDNRSAEFIRNSLSTEIEVNYREEMDYARVFETAGGYAPTMGIIGAVLGLIQVVQAFGSLDKFGTDELGMGVAAAFSATLYGVAISNLVLLPLAGKLRQKARDEWFKKTLMIEGIMAIHNGDHPIIVGEKLSAFLGSDKRVGAFFQVNSAAQQPRHDGYNTQDWIPNPVDEFAAEFTIR
jgi:chemotaxis protein MotA